MMKKKDTITVVYTDRGPSGPSGQSSTVTNSWTRVFHFPSLNALNKYLEEAGKGKTLEGIFGRNVRSARVEIILPENISSMNGVFEYEEETIPD